MERQIVEDRYSLREKICLLSVSVTPYKSISIAFYLCWLFVWIYSEVQKVSLKQLGFFPFKSLNLFKGFWKFFYQKCYCIKWIQNIEDSALFVYFIRSLMEYAHFYLYDILSCIEHTNKEFLMRTESSKLQNDKKNITIKVSWK